MRKRSLFLLGLVSIAVVLGLSVYLVLPGPLKTDPSPLLGPYFDNGYDVSPRYRRVTKESRFITMPDGTRLAADIFLPTEKIGDETTTEGAGALDPTKFPTILRYTPYGRSAVQPGMSWWRQLGLRWSRGVIDPIIDHSQRAGSRHSVLRGYAVVVVDMRGTGASFGRQWPFFAPQIGADGAEVVQWIASQEWSDGNVGMTGASYDGWSQFATASQKPEALKCIAPSVILFDVYSEGLRPGGILASRWVSAYSELLRSFNLNRLDPNKIATPAGPVTDEDGDGRLIDEIPVYSDGDPTLFTDEAALRYADGVTRERNDYYEATLQHRENIPVSRLLEDDIRFADARIDVYGEEFPLSVLNAGATLDGLTQTKIPVLHIGGWFDTFVQGSTKFHASLQGKVPSKLLIGPRFHRGGGDVSRPYKSLFGYQGNHAAEAYLETSRFFDWCLRGQENGYDQEPPVQVYVMNKGWRSASQWPLPRQTISALFLDSGGSLSTDVGSAGVDHYAIDFNHQSNYGSNQSNRWFAIAVPDEVMERTEHDKRALVFESQSLQQDTEVTGHPVVHLWVSADQDDADLHVYLSDVDQEGSVRYVTEGKLRASFHQLTDTSIQTGGTIEVKPELPWRGFRSVDEDVAPLANGQVVELRFDLLPTSWLFAAGHKIRVSIAGADLDNFELNPTLCPDNDVASCKETTIGIHRGPTTASRIELPVISPE